MLDQLERMFAARTIESLWATHLARMAELGFDRAIYAFTRFRSGTDFGRLEDMLILSNHDQAYIDGFIRSRLFEKGPMTRWAAQNSGACLWSWIGAEDKAGRLSAVEREVVAFNLEHGLRAGVSIAFPDASSRASGAIGLCAKDGIRQHQIDEIWMKNGAEITVLNRVFHLCIGAMPLTTSARRLSKRQREVLELVSEGLTTAAIASRIGLTQATVEKHLRLAREALEVETTAQALLKASMQRQIFIATDP